MNETIILDDQETDIYFYAKGFYDEELKKTSLKLIDIVMAIRKKHYITTDNKYQQSYYFLENLINLIDKLGMFKNEYYRNKFIFESLLKLEHWYTDPTYFDKIKKINQDILLNFIQSGISYITFIQVKDENTIFIQPQKIDKSLIKNYLKGIKK